MKEILTFHSIIWDTALITPETQGKIPLLIDQDGKSNSNITDLPEPELIRFLMANIQVRSFIFRELGMPYNAFYRDSVAKPVIDNPNKKPGDVDLLICDKVNPHQSVAIEGKRIKVATLNEQDEIVSKLDGQNVIEGVKQAKGLRNLGFYNSYLALLVETDGRNRKECNTLSRHLNNGTLKKLYDFPYRDKLYQEIGIIIIEIVHPTNKNYSGMSQVNVCIVKGATPLEQPVILTNKISLLLNPVI